MKKGWEQKTFENCIEHVEYTRKVQRKDFLLEGQFPVISQEAEFTNGFWDDEADLFKLSKPVIIFGDHTQVLKYVDFDFVLGADGVKILQSRSFLWPKFFFYQLQATELPSLGYARHYRLLKELVISIPPLPEQQRIVGLLDEAFGGLATAQAHAAQNLQNARALFESHLNAVFTQRGKGWVEKTLKEVCEKITDGTHQTPKYFESGVVFLSSRNVTAGVIDWENVKYIDEKQHSEMHRRVAPCRNDILLAKNGTTGVAAIVDRDTVFDIYVSLAHLRTLPVVRPRFLLHFINSPVAKVQFNKRLKGVGVPNLHLEEIREVRIEFPADTLVQDQVVTHLDALSAETQRLTRIYEQKLAALAALKKSLLHQAFSGEL